MHSISNNQDQHLIKKQKLSRLHTNMKPDILLSYTIPYLKRMDLGKNQLIILILKSGKRYPQN